MRTIPPNVKYRTTAGAGSASKVADKAMGKIPAQRRGRMREHSEQVAVIQWARANRGTWPELDLLFAIPNGGHRDVRTAARLRAEGVLAGVPDLFLPVSRLNANGLFIEMKVKPNKPTAAQMEFIERVIRQFYRVRVCYSYEDAVDAIREYLK